MDIFNKNKKNITIDELLSQLDNIECDPDVKQLLYNFITDGRLTKAHGILIIHTFGKDGVDIDGTHYTEQDAVWAFEKAKYKLLQKLISF